MFDMILLHTKIHRVAEFVKSFKKQTLCPSNIQRDVFVVKRAFTNFTRTKLSGGAKKLSQI